MAIRVLYVHHAGTFGGASRSLLELIKAFPAQSVDAHLITQRGEVATLARESGAQVIEACGVSQFDHTRYGHYRGRRWLLLLRESAYLPPILLALIRARRRWPEISIVHVNEVTMLPLTIVVRILFRCPVVVHVRSVQFTNDRSQRSRLLNYVLRLADAVIVIDETVRRSLPANLPCEVIHNGLGVTIPERLPRTNALPLRVGMVGNLLGLKGVHEFVEAARICKSRSMNVKFVIFGRNVREQSGILRWLLAIAGFARDIERDVRQSLQRNNLEDTVTLAGFNADLNQVYESIDILCFPSHLDAPGRPVFEAAFWGVPSIVAVQDPTHDTFVPGETGIAIAPRDPVAIANAVAHFFNNPQEVERMGENAKTLAMKNFQASNNAIKVLAVYRRLLDNYGTAQSCAS